MCAQLGKLNKGKQIKTNKVIKAYRVLIISGSFIPIKYLSFVDSEFITKKPTGTEGGGDEYLMLIPKSFQPEHFRHKSCFY